ncbi:dynamin family protein [Algibacter sp. L1A34]|uniref:dynamin family protein n=1 Tax=Algibacter sp. L1A34 TaxID=2686365 RepID=UPI00131B7B30|nr:dynamin family protein [Algibacter sp. L1A34]
MDLNIKYNTYTYNVSVDGSLYNTEGFTQSKNIINDKNNYTRIENWFYKFLFKYQEESNEDNFKIVFTSTKYEINIVKDIIIKFNQIENKDIRLIENVVQDVNLVGDFKDVLNNIKRRAEDDEIRQYFEKNKLFKELDRIEETEAQIVVSATMSAGKSTLINALLGEDLLPYKNEACTAAICKIKDYDGRKTFSAVVKNEKGEKSVYKEVDASVLKAINDKGNDQFITIEIEGDIKNIVSKNIKTVLVDTPGPNNSKNDKHKEITFNYINDTEHKPLILYVLNVTALQAEDDYKTLKEIADFVKDKGVSTEDRFVFVLNKIDEIDHEKESLENIISSIKKYLEQSIGIENPKIFPISAQFAFLSFLNESSTKLTRTQKGSFDKYLQTFLSDVEDDYKGIDAIEFTPLPELNKQELIKELNSANILKQCLSRSGISALQIYIQNYIENVHEIELGHDLYVKLLPHLFKLRDSIKGLTNNQRKTIESDIKKISTSEKILKIKLEDTREKLYEIKSDNSILDNLRERATNDFNEINSILGNKKVSWSEATQAKGKVEDVIRGLEISLKTTVKYGLEANLINKWEDIINIINTDFKDYLSEIHLSEKASDILLNDFSINLRESPLMYTKIDCLEFIRKNEEKVSSWRNPFTRSETIKTSIYANTEYYDLKLLFQDMGILEQKRNIEDVLLQIGERYSTSVNEYKLNGKIIIDQLEKNITKIVIERLSFLMKKQVDNDIVSNQLLKCLEGYISKLKS